MKQARTPSPGVTAKQMRQAFVTLGPQIVRGLSTTQKQVEQDHKRIEKDIQRGSRLSSGRIPY